MLIWILIIVSVIIFLFFYHILGREWYGPYSLFFVPMLLCYLIAAINTNNWNFELSKKTFWILIIGELSFFIGCFIAKKIVLSKKTISDIKSTKIDDDKKPILSTKLFLVVLIEFIFFAIYLIYIYKWGINHGCSIKEAINKIMLNGKFNGNADPLNLPFLLQIGLQMNYIIGYLFAFLIAKRIIKKERDNRFLFFIGLCISILTNFLGGSRGPILEIICGLIVSFGIVFFIETQRKAMKVSQLLKIVFVITIIGYVFFNILPLMGRRQTAENKSDVFAQYIGSQIYNLNYFVENVDKHSTFFCAETLKSFYNDIESFTGLSIGYKDGMVGNFFVYTPNGHDLGNVFTTYYNFYIDFGIIGVIIFTMFMGWFSEKIFKKVFDNTKKSHEIWIVLYIYIVSSIAFSFFASRFFQNVIQLKMIIKIFWLCFVYLFIRSSNTSLKANKPRVY